MATKRKGRCVKTQFDRKILCAGSLDKYIEIVAREIQGTEPGETIPAEGFTPVIAMAGKLEAKKYTPRFDGVSTEDQSAGNFTHAAYIPFDQTVYELDVNTLYVKIAGARDRLFKLKGIMDYDEDSQWLQLKLAETGFLDLPASQG